MLVSCFNLSQSFNCTPYLFYKKRFKSEINSFCIWTLEVLENTSENRQRNFSAQKNLDPVININDHSWSGLWLTLDKTKIQGVSVTSLHEVGRMGIIGFGNFKYNKYHIS